ncbi:MAG: metallophosphoesterase [Wenzhouxiangellaceae bacterium]|nr:metallophosphoesterase [Wenzhouxiangellaceae bacterium]
MSTGVRLLQVSDCHLAADAAADYRGRDADANLQALDAAVRAFAPDRLVLTGDLSEDGSEESYRRIADWAGAWRLPVAWLPGNHDDREVMAPIFAEAGFDAGPVVTLGEWQLLLLDSAWPGRPEGELDDERLAAFDALEAGRRTGIFVHHQPLPVGAPWIDRVGMEAADRLWQRIDDAPGVQFVAFGHVHQRFRSERGPGSRPVPCLGAPSSAANSLPGTDKFAGCETEPMARWFVLSRDGFRSGILAPGAA